MGEGIAFSLGASRQQDCSHGGALSDAVGLDLTGKTLDGVIDGETGGDGTSGRVDVEVDILSGVFRLQKEKLGDDEVGNAVVDGHPEKDDPVLEEP
jgi:hypothetical protein